MRDQHCPNLNCQVHLPFRFSSIWGFQDCPGCGIHLILNDINYPMRWLVVGNRRNPDNLEGLEQALNEYEGFYDMEELLETLKYNWDFIQKYYSDIDFTTILGCGGMGCAFPIDDQWTAKITFDEKEINAFAYLLGCNDLSITRGFVDIKEIIELERAPGCDLACIIIKEHIEPITEALPKEEVIILNEALYRISWGELHGTYKQRLEQIDTVDTTDLFNTMTQLREQKIEIGDIKITNLGVTNDGRVVIFDAQL